MTDIAVIILAGNEARHIGRCLERLRTLNPRQVFVVESQRDDNTHEVAVETARSLGWNVGGPSDVKAPAFATCFHKWPGLQAVQFNWAIDNLPIVAGWILRLDADEYLANETVERFREAARPDAPASDFDGMTLVLKRKFCGGEICHATTGIRQVRMFRRGKGRYAETLMDERIIVDGEVVDFDGSFYDDSLMPMPEWRAKHHAYAKREARQALESLASGQWVDPRKAKYYRLPPYLRAVLYFVIRYFLKGGFLDGYAGWMWNFWQGLWYRCLVDWEIGKLKRAERMR